MSILGIDFGLKRIVIACTDELNISSHPIMQIDNKPNGEHVGEIVKIIEERSIRLVLVGMPFKSDGHLKIQDEIEDFVKDLEKKICIQILLWDENFTTKEAEDFLIINNFSRKKRKKIKDMLSACNIIDSYIRSLK